MRGLAHISFIGIFGILSMPMIGVIYYDVTSEAPIDFKVVITIITLLFTMAFGGVFAALYKEVLNVIGD